jgi:hypothetical protein
VELFGVAVTPDQSLVLQLATGQKLRLGWATGDAAYLEL